MRSRQSSRTQLNNLSIRARPEPLKEAAQVGNHADDGAQPWFSACSECSQHLDSGIQGLTLALLCPAGR